MIFDYRGEDKVNMENLRRKIGMFSVNQLNHYHVLLEAFNIIKYGSADKIQAKWLPNDQRVYSNRRKLDVKVQLVEVTCRGFSWYGAKIWNKLPEEIKSMENPDTFKARIKSFNLGNYSIVLKRVKIVINSM